jgi:prepilin-type N-terminal cleavage/methylation domain-containing protein
MPSPLLKNPHTLLKKTQGFTVVELMIVVVILSIIIGIATPEIMEARKCSRGLACGNALRQIEQAKEQWRRDYPGQPISTVSDLLQYFPGGQVPQDPWGVGFVGVTDLTVITTHPYNNNPAYEPNNNCSSTNGYNDIAQPR